MPQKFGWAHILGSAITSSLGPEGGIQFKTGDINISGSDNFTFTSGSSTLNLTGSLEVTGSSNFAGFAGFAAVGNKTTISTSTDIGSNYNLVLYGPITIGSGASLTVGSSSKLKIKDIDDV